MSIYKKTIFAVTFAFLLCSMGGCETLEDTYKDFIGYGEITYIGKADSVKTRGGRNRIELSWLLISDPKVSNYKVFWNDGSDSISGDVVKTDQVDTVRIMFNDLKENYYQFDIFMFDNFGNSSIRSTQIGRVYGDEYGRMLLNRTYSSSKRDGKDLIIEWMSAESDLHGVELKYNNTFGEMVMKFVPGETTTDTLFNFPVNGSIDYRSAFLPEPLALDTFYTAINSITFSK